MCDTDLKKGLNGENGEHESRKLREAVREYLNGGDEERLTSVSEEALSPTPSTPEAASQPDGS